MELSGLLFILLDTSCVLQCGNAVIGSLAPGVVRVSSCMGVYHAIHGSILPPAAEEMSTRHARGPRWLRAKFARSPAQ